MNSSNNNNWVYENPLFKNKNQRYYYDFGTGNKIERADVKEKRGGKLEYFDGQDLNADNNRHWLPWI